MTLDKFIGLKMREIRLAKGSDAAKVAAALSISQEKYAAVELGKVRARPEVIIDAALFFDVPVTYFLDGFEVSDEVTADRLG